MTEAYNLTRFKDHVASYWCDTDHLGTRIERLVFRKPNSGIDYIQFLSIHASLIVSGDLFEGIYAVSGTKSLTWWEGTSADYLSGKLRDLNGGRADASEVWCSQQAEEQLKLFKEDLMKNIIDETRSEFDIFKTDEGNEEVTFENWLTEHLESLNEFDDQKRKTNFHTYCYQLKFWNEYEPERYTSDEHEWITFLHDHGTDIFGDCHHESGTYNIGKKRNPMIDVHKIALDLALKQLREKGTVFHVLKD